MHMARCLADVSAACLRSSHMHPRTHPHPPTARTGGDSLAPQDIHRLVGAGELDLMLAVEMATDVLSQPSRWHPFFHSITNHEGKQMEVNRGASRDVEGMRGGGDGRGRRGGGSLGLVTANRNAPAAAKVKHEDKKSLGACGAWWGRGGEKKGEDLVRAGMVLRLVSSSPTARSCVTSSLLLRCCVRCAWCSSSLLFCFLLSALALAPFCLPHHTHTHTHTHTNTHTHTHQSQALDCLLT